MTFIRSAIASILCLYSLIAFSSDGEYESLGNGFTGFYHQTDPFDATKKEFYMFNKGDFWFSCNEISFISDDDASFDSFSFKAVFAFQVDDKPSEELSGKYSTFLFGSDTVFDSRVYSTRMTQWFVSLLKEGNLVRAAGKFGGSGWTTKSLDLKGFTAAYDKACP